MQDVYGEIAATVTDAVAAEAANGVPEAIALQARFLVLVLLESQYGII